MKRTETDDPVINRVIDRAERLEERREVDGIIARVEANRDGTGGDETADKLLAFERMIFPSVLARQKKRVQVEAAIAAVAGGGSGFIADVAVRFWDELERGEKFFIAAGEAVGIGLLGWATRDGIKAYREYRQSKKSGTIFSADELMGLKGQGSAKS